MRTERMVLIGLVAALVMVLPATIGPTHAQTRSPYQTGRNPQVVLGNLSGPAFDTAYMQYLYQLNYDIASLANVAARHAGSRELRDFSRKIAVERNDINRSLGEWYPRRTNGQLLAADPTLPQVLLDQLNRYSGVPFDVNYARTMIPLMQQSMDAANLAKEKAVTPEVRDQVRLVWKTNSNESEAFQRWLRTGFLTFHEQQWYCENEYRYGWGYDPNCFGMVLPRGPLFNFGYFRYRHR